MRELCSDLIGRLADRGECDFIGEFAKYYFPYLGAQWLGAPESDWAQLAEWAHEIFKLPPGAGDAMPHMSGEAMTSLIGYLNSLVETKRHERDNSFTSFLVHEAKIDDRPLAPEEIRGAMTIAALDSGHTVTAQLGYMFKHLADHPRLQKLIRDTPEVVSTLREELMREYSLFGDPLFVMYTIPNRDPRCPGFDHFDATRNPNPHLAFAHGPRRCIGQHWARISTAVVVEEWHRRIPEYRVKPGAELREQVYAGVGYWSLPLAWS